MYEKALLLMSFYKGGKETIKTCTRLQRKYLAQPGCECIEQITEDPVLVITTIPYLKTTLKVPLFLPVMSESMKGWIEGKMNTWVHGRMDGWMGRWMDGWIEGWIHRGKTHETSYFLVGPLWFYFLLCAFSG